MYDVTARTEDQVNGGFAGTITLENGDEVDGDLGFEDARVVLRVAGSPVGDWSSEDFDIDRSDDGVYSLEVEDEVLSFRPEDESGFAAALSDMSGTAVAEIHPIVEEEDVEAEDDEPRDPEAETASPSDGESEGTPPVLGGGRVRLAAAVSALVTDRADRDEPPDDDGKEAEIFTFTGLVGEDSIITQRDLRSSLKTRRFTAFDIRSVARKAGIVVAIAVVVGILAWTTPRILSSFSTEAAPTTTVPGGSPTTVSPQTTAQETTVTTEAVVTTTTVAPEPTATAFDVPTPEFVSTWNDVGGEIAPALEFPSLLPTGAFESEFTPYLWASGVVGLDGTLESLTLSVDPLGPTGSDALALQALGVMIAVVDPSIAPDERASLLAALGLDVRRPQLGGVDGELEANGVRYRLFYDEEAVLLTFTAVPAA